MMKSLTRAFAGLAVLALPAAVLLGIPGERTAAALEPETKPAAVKVASKYDHTAFGAVIKANYNRVPASGAELVRALKKVGDFAQLPIPFSAVNTTSSLATPRVIIAPRPGSRVPEEGEGTEPMAKAPVRGAQPVQPAKLNGIFGLEGIGGLGVLQGFQGLGGGGVAVGGVGGSREPVVTAVSQAKATEPSLEGRLFMAANMEKTDDGLFRVKTIEIISWNSRKKRFDFGVIECGTPTPELQMLDGVRCFTCHKNKGPILGQGPWSNSMHNDVVRATALRVNDVFGLKRLPPPPKDDPDAPPALNVGNAATEPLGGWSSGIRNTPSLAQIKEATTFDGMSLAIPEPEVCDAAVRQGGELIRGRDVYRAMTRSPDGRKALGVLFAAIACPGSIEQSSPFVRRDLDLAFNSNFPYFADEFVSIHKASANVLADFSPSGSMGTLKSITTSMPAGWGSGSSQRTDTVLVWGGDSQVVTKYLDRRANGEIGMPSQRQPSNPRAFLRPPTPVPAKPSTAVNPAGLARMIGLTDGDRKFMSDALASLTQKIGKPKVTVGTLAKEVFATPHFLDVVKANDIPDREEFKERFATALADVAKTHKLADAVSLKREEYASLPEFALTPGQEDKEVAVVPTTACQRCHDVKGVGKPGFNPIPALAFDPFDKASRELWVKNNTVKSREQVLSRMLKRVAGDKDMPPEDAPEYEKFRTKDQAGFDALRDWLEAELKNAKGG